MFQTKFTSLHGSKSINIFGHGGTIASYRHLLDTVYCSSIDTSSKSFDALNNSVIEYFLNIGQKAFLRDIIKKEPLKYIASSFILYANLS